MNTKSPAGRFELESLDQLLAEVIQQNPEKVAGWISQEPGCWGFLAGKSVTVCRSQLGRSLTDQERRIVWHRLWTWLEQIKLDRQ